MSPMKQGSKNNGLEAAYWEVRPGGMLVQKRNSDQNYSPTTPTIKVTVKYGLSSYDTSINPHASFGDLKKMVAREIGLQPQHQNMFFMKKEMDSRSYLDTMGVKNGSKILLSTHTHKKNPSNFDIPSRNIALISQDIDKLAKQVEELEDEMENGKRVMEKNIINLTEELMIQVIKLDGISADGQAKQLRRMQVKRVQKYIEILDTLKVKNSSNLYNRKR